MDHIYHKIWGKFDFEDIYSQMVQEAQDGDIFIECGVLCGKSTAFMCVEIVNSGKKIELHAVDNFSQGLDMFPDIENDVRKLLKPFEFCTVHKADSVEFLRTFPKKVKFVFIDTIHFIDPLIFEIIAATRIAEYIGGHDYCAKHNGVIRTVDEYCRITNTEKLISNVSFLFKNYLYEN